MTGIGTEMKTVITANFTTELTTFYCIIINYRMLSLIGDLDENFWPPNEWDMIILKYDVGWGWNLTKDNKIHTLNIKATVEHHDLNLKDLENHLENVWNTKIRARKYARVGTWNRNPCRRLNDLRVNRTTRRPAQGIMITWSVTGDQRWSVWRHG